MHYLESLLEFLQSLCPLVIDDLAAEAVNKNWFDTLTDSIILAPMCKKRKKKMKKTQADVFLLQVTAKYLMSITLL